MEGKRLESDLRNWAKVMGVMPDGKASEVFRKLCRNERKMVWERVFREIRPAHEVEHIRKHLALKKMSQKAKLRQQLAEKEEEICIIEHDFDQAHLELKVLSCQTQTMKQKIKDLTMKTLILRYKKHDLEKKATRYEELCQVASLLPLPVEADCGSARLSCTSYVEVSCQNAICECKAQILELHKLYKVKDVNMQILHKKKDSVMEFVRHRLENFTIPNIWHTLLNSLDQLTKEILNLTHSNARMESQLKQAVKEFIDSETRKFMKSHMELFAAHHSLQHKMNKSSSECDVLLDSTVEMLQKLHGYKLDDTFQDSGGIRRWLELQITFTELGIIITEALPNEVKNLKVNTNSSKRDFLSLQEEETKRLSNDIERLLADMRTNFMWLTKSRAGHIETETKLKQEVTKLSQIFALDKYGMTTLDASVKGLQGAYEHEFEEFMVFPLHLLDNMTLPLGHTLSSSQQILKYHDNLINMDELHGLSGNLTALEGVPSAALHGTVLQILEKKLYLNFLITTEVDNNELSPLTVLDISSVENAATTAITEITKVAEKSIEECKAITERMKDNYRTWLEHPLQLAVPENLHIYDKNFQQWQCEYDSLLTTLVDLESEEEVPHML